MVTPQRRAHRRRRCAGRGGDAAPSPLARAEPRADGERHRFRSRPSSTAIAPRPTSSRCCACSTATWRALGGAATSFGPARWLQRLAHAAAREHPRRLGAQHHGALRSRQRLLRRLARSLDELFLGDLRGRGRDAWKRRRRASSTRRRTAATQRRRAGAGNRLRLGRAGARGSSMPASARSTR